MIKLKQPSCLWPREVGRSRYPKGITYNGAAAILHRGVQRIVNAARAKRRWKAKYSKLRSAKPKPVCKFVSSCLDLYNRPKDFFLKVGIARSSDTQVMSKYIHPRHKR